MDMIYFTYEYVPFVKETEVNRAALRKELPTPRPDWVGAVARNAEMLRELGAYVPVDCFLGSAELYPDGSANVFVRVSPDVPAVGFIRVRTVFKEGEA